MSWAFEVPTIDLLYDCAGLSIAMFGIDFWLCAHCLLHCKLLNGRREALLHPKHVNIWRALAKDDGKCIDPSSHVIMARQWPLVV